MVKPKEWITEAWASHGVRTFAIDHTDELAKLGAATDADRAVVPVVRMKVIGEASRIDLGSKFGADAPSTIELLRMCRDLGYPEIGLTFHVGSQCTDPGAFGRAAGRALGLAATIGLRPCLLDIGGGFPAGYVGTEPGFDACIRSVTSACAGYAVRLQCEPGRLLAAKAASMVIRVEMVRGDWIHLNDGIYGSLGELKVLPSQHPLHLVPVDGRVLSPDTKDWGLYGPTCDSLDSMQGPFRLPTDVRTGDWVVVDLAGAYSLSMSTEFNGFSEARVVIDDEVCRIEATEDAMAA
jgi:ornithine decarboxylase